MNKDKQRRFGLAQTIFSYSLNIERKIPWKENQSDSL